MGETGLAEMMSKDKPLSIILEHYTKRPHTQVPQDHASGGHCSINSADGAVLIVLLLVLAVLALLNVNLQEGLTKVLDREHKFELDHICKNLSHTHTRSLSFYSQTF